MNILLYTNDNIRENALKHVRGGSTMFNNRPYRTVVARRGNKSFGSNTSKSSMGSFMLSPLPLGTKDSLKPQQNHTHLNSEVDYGE
jgi:hypothetical protein